MTSSFNIFSCDGYITHIKGKGRSYLGVGQLLLFADVQQDAVLKHRSVHRSILKHRSVHRSVPKHKSVHRSVLKHTHTHTHTHIYIYIYKY